MKRFSGGGDERACLFASLVVLVLLACLSGCRQKISPSQCNQMLDHFADLVVKERFADAGAETLEAERARERRDAKTADEFKNCPTQVQANEHDCAMKAETSDALIKCLE